MSEALATKKKIFNMLKHKNMTVPQLSKKLHLSRATIRQHIKDLQTAGAVIDIQDQFFRKHVSYRAKSFFDGKTLLKNAKARWHTGNVLFEQGKLDDALHEFSAAIKLDPKYADAYFNRALTQRMLHNDDEVIRDLNKVLELQPTSPDAAVLMGDVEEAKGDLENARQWYEKALKYYPFYAEAKNRLAKVQKLLEAKKAKPVK